MEDECRHRTIIMLANHLARALQTDRYQWYGISVIQDLMRGIPWQASGYFPRVSLCDFTVRQMANIQKYSVQCVLVINIFTEKIFILLWFWYGILLVATSISFIYCYRIHSDLLINNSEQRFSEDTTLKLVEDGGTPIKIKSTTATFPPHPSKNNKQKRRADSAPLGEEKEFKTKLLPIENENKEESSSSSNSSSKENQNESDEEDNKTNNKN
uniref:Innexin n=1 Tax=Meloidogyne javanica TaxID=6303 RepID=A0A915N5P4_MELJA